MSEKQSNQSEAEKIIAELEQEAADNDEALQLGTPKASSLAKSVNEESKQSRRSAKMSRQSKDDQDEDDEDEEDEDDEESDSDCVIKSKDLIFLPESMRNNWLKSRGKEQYIEFEEEEMRQLREYFGSLDDDGSGSIGVDELEDPLIALGLVDNRQQVKKIVEMVDDDGSELIEFQEFLGIIRGGSNAKEGAKDDGTGAIFHFFKDLTNGKMKIDGNEHIPFSLFISSQRRRKILQAMPGWTQDQNVKKDGEKILNNYKKQLAEKLAREAADSKQMFSKPPAENQSKGSMKGTARSKFGATGSSFTSSKTRDLEAAQQKVIQQKLFDVSNFNGEPPEAEQLLAILRNKTGNH